METGQLALLAHLVELGLVRALHLAALVHVVVEHHHDARGGAVHYSEVEHRPLDFLLELLFCFVFVLAVLLLARGRIDELLALCLDVGVQLLLLFLSELQHPAEAVLDEQHLILEVLELLDEVPLLGLPVQVVLHHGGGVSLGPLRQDLRVEDEREGVPDAVFLLLGLLGDEPAEGPLDFGAVDPDSDRFDDRLAPCSPVSVQDPHDGRQDHVARVGSVPDPPDDHVLERDELLLLFMLDHISSLEQEQLGVPQPLLQELVPFDDEIALDLSEILLRHVAFNPFSVCVLLHLLIFVDEIASILHLPLLLHFQLLEVTQDLSRFVLVFDNLDDFILKH